MCRVFKGLAAAGVVSILLCAGWSAQAITHGEPDGDAHPYVGMVVAYIDDLPVWVGSGVLISPTVMVTAGHCVDGAQQIRVWFDSVPPFGEVVDKPYGGHLAKEFKPHPLFAFTGLPGLPKWLTHDVAIIVLEEPVTLSGYASLPTLRLAEKLGPMPSVDLVGYGVEQRLRGGGRPMWAGSLTRNYVPSHFIRNQSIIMNEFLRVCSNPAKGNGGIAFGDSGGPVLYGTTVLAVNSFVANPNCAGVTDAARIDTEDVLSWISSFLK